MTRRLLRIVIRSLTVLSLVLCCLVMGFWFRSWDLAPQHRDGMKLQFGRHTIAMESADGDVLIDIDPATDEVAVPYWPLALTLMVLPTIAVRSRLRRVLRYSRGLCPSCGYDLRATPDRCPECGAVAAAETVA